MTLEDSQWIIQPNYLLTKTHYTHSASNQLLIFPLLNINKKLNIARYLKKTYHMKYREQDENKQLEKIGIKEEEENFKCILYEYELSSRR